MLFEVLLVVQQVEQSKEPLLVPCWVMPEKVPRLVLPLEPLVERSQDWEHVVVPVCELVDMPKSAICNKLSIVLAG